MKLNQIIYLPELKVNEEAMVVGWGKEIGDLGKEEDANSTISLI